MAYDAVAVANFFLDLGDINEVGIGPMKIQKLVYFAHGWHLALRDQPLIRERIEAWEFGPVIPPLYHQFKKFGNGSITERAITCEYEGTGFREEMASIEAQADENTNAFTRSFLERIWEAYGGLSGIQLSNLTHVPGSPWAVTFARSPGRRHLVIDDDLIKADFKKKMTESENSAS